MSPEDHNWVKVDRWARSRAEERGDLYGWSRVTQEDGGDAALLLVAEDSHSESFPAFIADIPVQLKGVPEPERQQRCL